VNIALPPFLLLIPYALFLLVVAFFGLVNIGHLFRYGARNAAGFLATFGFVSGAAVILFLTWQYLPELDWTEPVPLVSTTAKSPY
jgi:hypothetical protein